MKSSQPKLSKVWIHSEMGQIGCGVGNLERKTCLTHTVLWSWEGDERQGSHGGISCADKLKLAQRLKTAVEAGVVLTDPQWAINKLGQRYVSARVTVLGRTLNADLKRLGY